MRKIYTAPDDRVCSSGYLSDRNYRIKDLDMFIDHSAFSFSFKYAHKFAAQQSPSFSAQYAHDVRLEQNETAVTVRRGTVRFDFQGLARTLPIESMRAGLKLNFQKISWVQLRSNKIL